jgi:SOS response regulatory protein OraA/RecX
MNNMKNLIAKLDRYNAVDNERFAEIINQTPLTST